MQLQGDIVIHQMNKDDMDWGISHFEYTQKFKIQNNFDTYNVYKLKATMFVCSF